MKLSVGDFSTATIMLHVTYRFELSTSMKNHPTLKCHYTHLHCPRTFRVFVYYLSILARCMIHKHPTADARTCYRPLYRAPFFFFLLQLLYIHLSTLDWAEFKTIITGIVHFSLLKSSVSIILCKHFIQVYCLYLNVGLHSSLTLCE